MKLNIKIPLFFGVALSVSLAAGLGGLLGVTQSLDTFENQVMQQVADERALTSMSGHFKTELREWKNLILRGSDSKLFEKHWTGFQAEEMGVATGAQALKGRLGDATFNEELDRFIVAQKQMAAGYREGFEKFNHSGFDSSVGDMAVRNLDAGPAKLLDDLVAKIAARRAEVANAAFAAGHRATWLAMAAMAIACALGIAIGLVLRRQVVAPLLQATHFAREVAQGNLSREVRTSGDDETAGLLRSLADMQTQLRRLVGSVRDNAEGVATASSDIAQGNQELSQRTEQQAAALQVTASTMEELAATARSSADNAQQANTLAQGAREVAIKGGEVVERVVHTMQGINESSRRIAEIISVIDGIAFQTNILALNAAVEAARAGEEGRGFAVVAAEVRSLAGRSAGAAKEIKALIEASVGQVDEGSRLVDEAGQTMREIVSAIRRVSDLVSGISTASGEQRTGVAQIGEEVGRMDQGTQQNAALVEESAAAAESLKQQALQLVQTVAVFKLA